MKLNLAVYTATEGYSWQSGTKISNSDLIEYKRIIGRFPDPTVDVIPFGGAFLCSAKAVFYRFHVAKQADSKGRDALYLVLGVCDKKQAELINFKELFSMAEFASANNKFPTELDYVGNRTAIANIDFSNSFNKNYSKNEDLSIIGSLLSNCPNEDLSIRIGGTEKSPNIAVVYKVTPIKVSNNFAQRVTNNNYDINSKSKFSSTYTPMDVNTANNTSIINVLTVIIAISFLVVGFLIGFFLRGFITANEVVVPQNSVVKEKIKSEDNFNNNRISQPVIVEIKTPQTLVNNDSNIAKEKEPPRVQDKQPASTLVKPIEVPEYNNTPKLPPKPNEINKPQNNCLDCGVATVGCQECRRTGNYRGRRCHFCNGKGEKEVIYFCPKHRKNTEIKLDNNKNIEELDNKTIKSPNDTNKTPEPNSNIKNEVNNVEDKNKSSNNGDKKQ